jgi:transposase
VHDLREIVNAILYVNRTGIPWEYPPHDFPPYKTVYDYYAKWKADGTTQQVHDLLRDYEALPQRSRAMIHWAMANKMSPELTGESTSTRRIETNMTVITA